MKEVSEVNTESEGIKKESEKSEARIETKEVTEVTAVTDLVKGEEVVLSEIKEKKETDADKKDYIEKELRKNLARIEAAKVQENSVKRAKLPTVKELLSPLELEEFFKETLLRVCAAGGSNSKSVVSFKTPGECIKSVCASGWNPPPLSRRAQGDLLYVEVITGTYRALT